MATITALTRSSTPDPILNLIGTYTGTYHWQRSNSSSSMRLEITQQHGPGFSGDCLLGLQRYPLLQTITSPAFGLDEGGITFTIDIPASQRQQATSLHFQGSVTKDGTMTGQVSSSDGKQGIWSVQKA